MVVFLPYHYSIVILMAAVRGGSMPFRKKVRLDSPLRGGYKLRMEGRNGQCCTR